MLRIAHALRRAAGRRGLAARTGPVHFVGISGAGVSALAELVLRSGGRVTGCDLRSGPDRRFVN